MTAGTRTARPRPDAPLLAVKLTVPSLPGRHVPRPALVARVDALLGRRLSVVVAAAGYGKTTLLSEVLAAAARRTPGPRTC